MVLACCADELVWARVALHQWSYSFSEGFLYGFKVYLSEPCEDSVVPVSVSQESVKMRMKVKSITSGL